MHSSLETALADMQGKLFEMSGEKGFASEPFLKAFMTSDIAAELDSPFDFMQWAGKEYIFERMQEELPEAFQTKGKIFNGETLYWAGFLYRKWHYYTGETSKQIYKQANARKMDITYLSYHCMDVEMAVDRLKEKN